MFKWSRLFSIEITR